MSVNAFAAPPYVLTLFGPHNMSGHVGALRSQDITYCRCIVTGLLAVRADVCCRHTAMLVAVGEREQGSAVGVQPQMTPVSLKVAYEP